MNSNTTPLVLIGLDGCDWNLINPWIENGELPNIAKIKAEGITDTLGSTIPPITGPALATFFTGLNPDNTGIVSFVKPNGRLISYNDIKEPTIWDYLGAAEIPSCIVGLRLTYPPRKINGIILSGGLLRAEGNDYIQPAEYLDKATGYHPDAKSYPELLSTLKKGHTTDTKRFVDELIRLTQKQFAIFTELRAPGKFPFSLLWVENTDVIQHFCWHEQGEILRLYKCIDTLIGEFLKENSNINLILISDHGFHSIPANDFNINGWLKEKGYLVSEKHVLRDIVQKAVVLNKRALSFFLSPLLKRKLRLFFEKVIKGNNPILEATGHAYMRMPLAIAAKKCNFEPDRTVAYTGEPWGIYIVDGVAGTQKYEEVRSRIISDMRSLLDKDNLPVFNFVWRKEELYSGRYFKDMPDILFLVGGRFHVNTYTDNRIFEKYDNPQKITGSHDQAYLGIIAGFGPDIDKNKDLKGARLVDLLPTILDYFNISLPSNADGKSWAEVFAIKRPAGKHISPQNFSSDSNAYSPSEEAEIKDRLKNLGYI